MLFLFGLGIFQHSFKAIYYAEESILYYKALSFPFIESVLQFKDKGYFALPTHLVFRIGHIISSSDIQLTLSAAIFTATPESYTIYQPNPEPNSFLLYVGTGGDLEVITSAPTPVSFKNVGDASFIPVNIGRVNASNTTASDIIALL